MRIFIGILLLCISLFGDMSINDAWTKVELKNSGVKAASDDVSRAKLKKESVESMYLPSVSITGSYTHLSKAVNIDTSEISNLLGSLPTPLPFPSEIDLTKQDVFLADLNLLWPLYTGGRIDAVQDIYAAQINEAKAKEAMKKDVEFLKLVKYYYGVVVAKSLYETRAEAQKALSLHYKNAKKLKNQGQIAKIELLNAEVKLEDAKIEKRQALHKLEIASSALASLTHSKEKPSSQLFVTLQLEDENYYKDETVKNYAGLKVLDAKATQGDALVSIKEAAWHPELLAYGNLNLYRDDSAIMSTLPKWFAGVMLKIDILQRKDRSQETEVARLLNDKVKHLKTQAIEDLKLLVEKSYKEMLSAYEEYEALNASIALAEENYKLRTIAFREGLSTSVELVDAQMFLMGAKTKQLNAAYGFVQKVAQLSVLAGDRELFFTLENSSKGI